MDDLKDPFDAKLDTLHLDPNNPRLPREDRPGYVSPEPLFGKEGQVELEKQMSERFKEIIERLQESILAQGWEPIDPILVWEHPNKKKHYVVVEGNTRLVTLRKLRSRLESEREKLTRFEKSGKYVESDLREQRELVTQLEGITTDTAQIKVYPINAATPEELERKLPRLMGVRHITHAQQWTPYATNLYILSLYEKEYRKRYNDGRDLALESDLIKRVAMLVSRSPRITRQNIQAAFAFSRFQRRFEDRLSENDKFRDKDHYYFEQILQNKYAADQFGFGQDKLALDDDMEEVLFDWAFKFPRAANDDEDEESKNKLRKAEDIRLWAKMKRYDDPKGTSFASRFDVENPSQAKPMREVEAEFKSHAARISPVNIVNGLLETFRDMQADTLLTQASHLRPMLEELRERSEKYLAMIEAVTK